MATFYIRSKSKTGKKPRTGNRYKGTYTPIEGSKTGERMFVLVGARMVKGKIVVDHVPYRSPFKAMQDGWVKVS